MAANPTLRLPWRSQLDRLLTEATPNRPARIAMVGIGSELRDDDAVGVCIARDLLRLLPADAVTPALLVVDAGAAPENCSGVLRRFAPDVVVLIDAAQMDEPPGTVRCLTTNDVIGLHVFTHSLPLPLLAEYLQAQLGCRVILLGIQPAEDSLDGRLSSPVQQARAEVVQFWLAWQRQMPQPLTDPTVSPCTT